MHCVAYGNEGGQVGDPARLCAVHAPQRGGAGVHEGIGYELKQVCCSWWANIQGLTELQHLLRCILLCCNQRTTLAHPKLEQVFCRMYALGLHSLHEVVLQGQGAKRYDASHPVMMQETA